MSMMTRKEAEAKIASLEAALANAEMRAAKFKKAFEESAKWQGFYKEKYNATMRGIARATGNYKSRREQLDAAKAAAIAGGRSITV